MHKHTYIIIFSSQSRKEAKIMHTYCNFNIRSRLTNINKHSRKCFNSIYLYMYMYKYIFIYRNFRTILKRSFFDQTHTTSDRINYVFYLFYNEFRRVYVFIIYVVPAVYIYICNITSARCRVLVYSFEM